MATSLCPCESRIQKPNEDRDTMQSSSIYRWWKWLGNNCGDKRFKSEFGSSSFIGNQEYCESLAKDPKDKWLVKQENYRNYASIPNEEKVSRRK